jgi:ribose 5-phosphate isomerase B
MRIAIASDHAAFDLKAELREYLIELGHEVADLGPDTADRVDYPDFGYRLAAVVADGTAERGVALCGSGIGISIAVNRGPPAHKIELIASENIVSAAPCWRRRVRS